MNNAMKATSRSRSLRGLSCALGAAGVAVAIGGCSSAGTEVAQEPARAAATEATVAGAIDGYLVAYRDGILEKKLQPTPALWGQARLAAASLSADADFKVRGIVVTLLDDALGFDFVPPTADGVDKAVASHDGTDGLALQREHGFFRSLPNEADAAALIDAVRRGLSAALAKGDSAEAPVFIQEFFRAHPDYHPMHSGRCYPHGHPDYREQARAPVDCVSDETRRAAGYVLRHARELAVPAVVVTQVQPQAKFYGNCHCYWSRDCPDWGSWCWHGFFSSACVIGGAIVNGKATDGVCSW